MMGNGLMINHMVTGLNFTQMLHQLNMSVSGKTNLNTAQENYLKKMEFVSTQGNGNLTKLKVLELNLTRKNKKNMRVYGKKER